MLRRGAIAASWFHARCSVDVRFRQFCVKLVIKSRTIDWAGVRGLIGMTRLRKKELYREWVATVEPIVPASWPTKADGKYRIAGVR